MQCSVGDLILSINVVVTPLVFEGDENAASLVRIKCVSGAALKMTAIKSSSWKYILFYNVVSSVVNKLLLSNHLMNLSGVVFLRCNNVLSSESELRNLELGGQKMAT